MVPGGGAAVTCWLNSSCQPLFVEATVWVYLDGAGPVKGAKPLAQSETWEADGTGESCCLSEERSKADGGPGTCFGDWLTGS